SSAEEGSMGAMTTRGAAADVGLIGLAVMGQNLALNMADHGYRVAVYNRTTATMEQFVGENQETPGGLVGCPTLEGLVAALKKPRKIIILVKAGAAVDGAGHYVKMVHNGIEYIDMQLISEAYHLLRTLGGLGHDELSRVFAEWNRGELQSYLIQITADILQQRDPTSPRKFLLDVVLDTAAQKGTGKWTAINALDLGIPANAIAEAVFARCLSALKDERVPASQHLRGPASRFRGGRKALVEAVRQALYCSKVCAYAQGFQLMAQAQREYGWTLDFATIASIWRGGCIIRARFLQKISLAYRRDGALVNLMLDAYFRRALQAGQES